MKWVTAIFALFWISLGLRSMRHEAAPPEPVDPATIATKSCVDPTLAWLARHQESDGRWSGARFLEHCSGEEKCTGARATESDIELTGLALLGFLAVGYTPQNRASYVDVHTGETIRFGETVRRGIRWLLLHQNPDGSFADGQPLHMRHQAIAALTLAEAYGITNARAYRPPARDAIAFIESSRAPDGVWGVTPGALEPDDLTTGECFMALKSAQIGGVIDTIDSLAAVKSWSATVATASGAHPTETAHRLLSRIFAAKKRGFDGRPLAAELLRDLPSAQAPDFEYWHVATLALFQLDAPAGPSWKQWSSSVSLALRDLEEPCTHGCREGSYDGPRGRLRATAEAMLVKDIHCRRAW